jgi:hypothetical protein
MTTKKDDEVAVIKNDADLTNDEINKELRDLNKKLNDKEVMFIRNYLCTNNKRKAGEAAGYSGTSLATYVYEVVKRPNVFRAINLEKLRIFRKLDITNEEILRSLVAIAKSNLADYLEYKTIDQLIGYGKKGKIITKEVTVLTLKDSNTIPYEVMGAIKSIKQGKYGVEFTLYDKPAALLKMAEYSGLFKSDGGSDLISKVLSDVTVQGMEISLKVMKRVMIEEAEVVDS